MCSAARSLRKLTIVYPEWKNIISDGPLRRPYPHIRLLLSAWPAPQAKKGDNKDQRSATHKHCAETRPRLCAGHLLYQAVGVHPGAVYGLHWMPARRPVGARRQLVEPRADARECPLPRLAAFVRGSAAFATLMRQGCSSLPPRSSTAAYRHSAAPQYYVAASVRHSNFARG